MRTQLRVFSLLAAALAVLFAACSGDDVDTGARVEEAQDQVEDATDTPVESTTPPAESDEDDSDSSAPTDQFSIGETAETAIGNLLTIHTYEAPFTDPTGLWTPDPGMVFATIDVEGCTDPEGEGGSLNPFDFRLQMPDNTRLDADVGVREPPLNHTELPPGDCVRGWVTFQVQEGITPATVNFETFDAEGRAVVIKWQVAR